MLKLKSSLFAAMAMLILCGTALAEDAKLPTKEQLANDNKLFITLATKALHWEEPQDPFHIAGPLYYVGTKGLAAYLFSTSEGLILLNTGDPTSGPMIEQSIKTLGFDPANIKIMINGHGHSDHAGGFAYLKKLAKDAKLEIMEGDVAMIEDGGKSDFHYGKDWKIMGQDPVKVDHVLHDGERVSLGDVTLTAYNTPGHTRGSTTWVTTLVDSGKAYLTVFPDGGGFNPGYKLTGADADFPGIESAYRNTHHFQEMLNPDMWFGFHAEYFDMLGKYARMAKEGVSVWVDPEGYREFIASKKRAFEDEIDTELGVTPKAQGEL